MNSIKRDFSEVNFDQIIIGGGIYGIMLAYISGIAGKKTLLLEKEDFNSQTSLNHLRTLHGGLRYLQSADFTRFFQSVKERKWFLKNFPLYTEPLPCLLPLYGKGLYKKFIFRCALLLNDLLSFNRNFSLLPSNRLKNGSIISAEKTREIFPQVKTAGLKGAAVWYDGSMPDHHRIAVQILKQACRTGTTALNYCEVKDLTVRNRAVKGLFAVDKTTGKETSFFAPVVINAAGANCRNLAKTFDQDYPQLQPKYILLYNILLKSRALSNHALAVMPDKNRGHTYFLHNWKERLLAGTGEKIVDNPKADSSVLKVDIEEFIRGLNKAIPELKLTEKEIDRIYSGILPANRDNTLAKKEVIINHQLSGGPKGLFSVSGVKFTTARLVAKKVLSQIYKKNKKKINSEDDFYKTNSEILKSGSYNYSWIPQQKNPEFLKELETIIKNESVLHLSDLIYRRTDLGENKSRIRAILETIRPLFAHLDKNQWEKEVKELF